MKILYLLESAELCGGVRIVFAQARALRQQGCHVRIKALRGDHRWYPHEVDVDYVSDLAADGVRMGEDPDVVIATFWKTVSAAATFRRSLVLHLCQGYEGDIPEYSDLRPQIEEIYALPIPKLTIGSWLTKRLEGLFGKGAFPIFEIGQIVDLEIYHPLPVWKRAIMHLGSRRVRVLIMGIYESSVKAIRVALEAVKILRAEGFDIHLTRVSALNLSREESELVHIDEYMTNVPPRRLTEIYQRSDIFCAPSLSYEGFGLPFAEALACGVPSIATKIPSHLSLDSHHDYACFVPEKDPAAIAAAARKIIGSRRLRRHLRKRGHEVIVKNFRRAAVAERLMSVFQRTRQ
jgi:glycosyltransferase involved in cell wall biosynthesis